MWEWLQGLSGGAANFIGSLTGSMIGLLAILGGALFNAHLNRRRDDRLRGQESAVVVGSIRAELAGFRRILATNATSLADKNAVGSVLIPILNPLVFPHVLPNLGLMRSELGQEVISVYGLVREYERRLVLMGAKSGDIGSERLIHLPGAAASNAAKLNDNMATRIDAALAALEAELKRL